MRTLALRLVLVLAAVLAPPAAAQGTLVTLVDNGPRERRINIVFLSEGYTDAELPRFHDDARRMLDAFLATAPIDAFRGFFNAYAIAVASAQSGADHPEWGEYRDTYFNATFNSHGVQRLVTIPPNDYDAQWEHGQGRAQDLLRLHVPEYNIVVLVVNDSEYGGSGGTIAVSTVHPAANEIVIHELGHSFAYLGDEYEDPYPGYPDTEDPNTTRETRREFVKWNAWINPETPVPTPETFPYLDVVGLFEGAHYHASGWYRPRQSCKMRYLGVPFCEVCREMLVRMFYYYVRPVEAAGPAEPEQVLGEAPTRFWVTPPPTTQGTLRVRWFLDDVPLDSTGAAVSLGRTDLPAGRHRLAARVRDETSLVRVDPWGYLRDSVAWHLEVPPPTADEPPAARPAALALGPAAPDPFGASTTLVVEVPAPVEVRLEVFDVLGRRVAVLHRGLLTAGRHPFRWDADGAPPGLYVVRAVTPLGVAARTVTRLR